MTNRYYDPSVSTGLNDGTSWANCFQTMAAAMAVVDAATDDVLWCRNASSANYESFSTTQSISPLNNNTTDIARMIGVKAATTTEPPIKSDWVTESWRSRARRLRSSTAARFCACSYRRAFSMANAARCASAIKSRSS